MLKNQLKKLTVAALVAAMIVPAGVSNADKQQVTRISGKDRITTSVEISKSAYTTSENVVLASGFNFADALSAGQLASALDAPLLLSSQNKLDSQTKNEIERLKAKKVFVVGGDNAISKTGIDTTLKSEKIEVTRLEGQDRYSTSQKVMEKTKEIINPEYLLIASGKNFPDALAATGFFVNHKSVMVLSDGITYPQSNLQEIAIGGKNQLPLKGFKGRRVSGKDRYETALEIAKLSFDKNNNAILASGEVFADSLSAVSLTKKHNAPIILTQSNSLTENAKKYLNDKNVFIVGGEKTVVNDILTRKKPVVNKEDKNLHTKTGRYSSTLIQQKLSKSKSRDYNQAYDVKIKGDYLIVSGHMKYFKNKSSFSDGKPLGESATHTFKITNKTEFTGNSGQARTSYYTPEGFIKYYNRVGNVGLSLSITVENGVVTKVGIYS
ncbi:MAG: cell wall-binding repeat-containing protein [Finegoldia magna]|uniref:cell wall-binding repeat-containing protein n=1 Tax=Finegoldia magna TaxID=1260 RepID=UPI00290F21CE|nr:cell wall-binding repeat-containing protein [Finegoldia magna]MDU5369725.1 cell wall-binding repeat-containing protein [Finegoldia magna]MDU5444315.1 cell wall-binding repeat-containing protein [Finegoldia magna]